MRLTDIYGQLGSIKNVSAAARLAGIERTRLWRILNGFSEPRLDELISLEQEGFIKIADTNYAQCPHCGATELLCGYGSNTGCCTVIDEEE